MEKFISKSFTLIIDKYYYLLFAFGFVATAGSLIFSEVLLLTPCSLCVWQRWLMYPIVPLAMAGVFFESKHLKKFLPILVLFIACLGMIIASYHYLYQMTDIFGQVSTVCADGAACKTVDWVILGFITIPLLSLLGFSTILILTILKLTGHRFAKNVK